MDIVDKDLEIVAGKEAITTEVIKVDNITEDNMKENVTKKRTSRSKKVNPEKSANNIEKETKAAKKTVKKTKAEEADKDKTRRKKDTKERKNENEVVIEEVIKPKTRKTASSRKKNEVNVETSEKTEKKKTSKRKTEIKPISDFDIYLFHEGRNYESYKFMGAHFVKEDGIEGVRFTTWAPNASSVAVVGDFSQWEIKFENKMKKITEVGLWSVFIPNLKENSVYKYAVTSKDGKVTKLKADPYSVSSEVRPNTASILIKNVDYQWTDSDWLEKRNSTNIYESPVNIYEVHAGSWKMKSDGSFYSYKELAEILPKYVKEMGYTHVEFMPVMEHPLDASWGYQATGYYTVTSRYGTISDFKALIDTFHNEGIGVILDWVPGHFCKDDHGLYMFDGSPAYEYAEGFKQENKGWGAANFDLGRPEVRSFLISNALYWLKEFHIDGLRVDAVANMIYLDYDRRPGEWLPNKYGGRENLEAVEFLRELNKAVFKDIPNALMVAEESTSWPMVTKPGEIGGLGFNFKWNMGWMNDMLKYIQLDPIYRKYHHNLITFSSMYQYSENFILPISHDEVVHGKKSLLDKMWGDYWNKFAGLRLFISFMMGHPGKKLLFMGSEFGQFIEWRDYEGLEFKLIEQFDMHRNTQRFFKDMNEFYKANSALWKYDQDPKGFEWIDADNANQSIVIFMRKSENLLDTLIFVCNFTPVVYYDFKIGVPFNGEYNEVFNTDSSDYGGSGQVMDSVLISQKGGWHKQKYYLTIKVPPMATLILKPKNIIEETENNEGLEKLGFDRAIEVAEKKLKLGR